MILRSLRLTLQSLKTLHMKKNYLFKPFLFLIPITAFALISFSGGVGGTRSGSPGDGGTTCLICHAAGADFSASAMITTNIPSSGYDVDTDYSVTVTATSTAPGHGFQLTAERLSDNGKIGTFVDDGGVTTRVQDAGERIFHANRNNSTWTFTWRSPSTLQGQVRFYASVNAVNNNGSNGGDQVVTAVSEPSNALSISENKLLAFTMFPNPSADEVNIQLPSGTSEAQVGVFDYTGRLVTSKTVVTTTDQKVDVNSLATGMYMIRVTSDGKIGAQRFIKQ
jgi:hypothetical protein